MSYIGNGTDTFVRNDYEYTASEGQTLFNAQYSVNYVDVYWNGFKLDNSEFVANNGTTIALNNPAKLGDKISIVAYNAFNIADTYSKQDVNTNFIDINHVPLSGIAAYHLIDGSLTVTNNILTNGFATTLYTGNGTTQSVVTGVDMATQWGNDATETFGGLVWIKERSPYAGYHNLHDTVRGINNVVSTNATDAQTSNVAWVNATTSTGFTLGGNSAQENQASCTYASWNFQTTHRITGTTNHGKAYTCHYNPFTGFTIVKYEGSGIAGHEIPHQLDRKLSFISIKNLSSGTEFWNTGSDTLSYAWNATNALGAASWTSQETSLIVANTASQNTSANQYILYGWANSYFDEANTLIGNYEVGIYQGTGAASNKVTTRGKPAWVMIKRLDSTGNWVIVDNLRGTTTAKPLMANLSAAETDYAGSDDIVYNQDGFTWAGTSTDANASGGQYLYMVVYDNDSGSGKSKYPRATDTSTLNLNATVPFANGLDASGAKNSILVKNETVSGLVFTEGKNYVYSKNDGTYGVSAFAPTYGIIPTRQAAGETPDYFNTIQNKWYSTNSDGGELVINGTFDTDLTGWTSVLGSNSVVNGVAKIYSPSTTGAKITQTISTVVGVKYKLKAFVQAVVDWSAFSLSGATSYSTGTLTSTTKQVDVEFVANSTSLTITFECNNVAGTTGYLENVSMFVLNPTINAEITESRNYLDAIVYADANGQPTYVEQLPKTVYYDEVKANEFKGKNACTAWGSVNGATTPPTIKDGYNVKAVIRTGTGVFDIYFEKPMDTANFAVSGSGAEGYLFSSDLETTTKVRMITRYRDGVLGNVDFRFQVFGGKN